MNILVVKNFIWRTHSDKIKGFHEDILVSNIKPKHMSMEKYLQLLRDSETNGLPAYIHELRGAYDEGKDGMFIWEMSGEVVGWSWLRKHKNVFFREGAYGEINEIYVIKKWRRKGIGKTIMLHAFNWFKKKKINIIRVEAFALNKPAVMFYEKFGFKPDYISFQKELSEHSLP